MGKGIQDVGKRMLKCWIIITKMYKKGSKVNDLIFRRKIKGQWTGDLMKLQKNCGENIVQEETEKRGSFGQNTEVILMVEYFQLTINCKECPWVWVAEEVA